MGICLVIVRLSDAAIDEICATPKKAIHFWMQDEAPEPVPVGFLGRLFGKRDEGIQKCSVPREVGDEWEARQEIFAQTNDLSADATDLSKSTQGVLADQLATLLAARYAALLHTWNGEVNKKLTGKLRVLHGLTSDVAKLRRGDHQNRRWKLQQDLLEEEQESTKEELFDRFWGWAGNPKVREVIARQYAAETNDPEVMRKLFGLPLTTPEDAGSVPRAARNPEPPTEPENETLSPGGKASWTACPATAATAADDAAFETPTTHELQSDSEPPKSGVAPAFAGFPPHSKTPASQGESSPVKPVTLSEASSEQSTELLTNEPHVAAPEEPVKPSQSESNQSNPTPLEEARRGPRSNIDPELQSWRDAEDQRLRWAHLNRRDAQGT